MRTCQSCAIEQPLSHFYRHEQGHNGRRSRCKGCEREQAQKARATKLAALKRDPAAYRAYRERRNSRDRERAAEGWRWTREHGRRRTALEEDKAAGRIGYTDWCEECGSAAGIQVTVDGVGTAGGGIVLPAIDLVMDRG